MKATSKPLGTDTKFHKNLQMAKIFKWQKKIVSYGQIAVKLKLLKVKGTNSQDKICEIKLTR